MFYIFNKIHAFLTIMLLTGCLSSCASWGPEDSEEESIITLDNSEKPDRPTWPVEFSDATPFRGYTLFSAPGPNASSKQRAALVDMEGKVVHQWSIVGMPVVMLPGGSLLGALRQREGSGAFFQDAIEVFQEGWNGQQEWSFSNWDDGGTGIMMSRQHHEIHREGNPVGYYAPGQAFVAQGKTLILSHKDRMVPSVSKVMLQDDVIYEVSWDGNQTGFIWQAADYFDEMGFDDEAKKAIYENPRFATVRGTGDWLHINSASPLGKNRWYENMGDQRFHPENILISAREACFIAIISRHTGHLVWRVGPNFGSNTKEHGLGQFVGQHHAHMIPHGLPGAGNILLLDNGGYAGYGGPTGFPKHIRGHSRVVEFNPLTLEKVWEYGEPEGPNFFYGFMLGSAQRLPNANTLITNGEKGTVFEVTRGGTVVWRYVSADLDDWGKNYLYRAYRLPPEWLPENPGGYPTWASYTH